MKDRAVRASDAERDATVDLMADSCAEGRLTLEEFSDRVEAALTSSTVDQLAEIVADLPAPVPGGMAPARASRRYVIGVLGSAAKRGRWQLGTTTYALAVAGSCELDLRHAVMEGGSATIVAVGAFGSVRIMIPDHIIVTVSGSSMLGSVEERVRRKRPASQHLPTVHVRGVGVMGSVEVVRAKPRRLERLRSRLRRRG